jgi:hypothetical protein
MTNLQKMRTLFKVYYEQCPDRRIEYTEQTEKQCWIVMEGIELTYMEYQGEHQPIFLCGRIDEVYYFKTYAECNRVWHMGEDEVLAYKKSLEEPSREEMIKALTRYELDYFLGEPSLVRELTKFFSEGGFIHYTDNGIKELYNDKILGQ